MKFKYVPITMLPMLLLASASVGLAQNCSIPSCAIATGGSSCALAQYVLSGTIGQAAAGGPLTTGRFSLTGGFWADGAVATQRPLLSITRSGPSVIISWPSTFSGFLLETTGGFSAGAVWTPVSQPAVQVGSQYYVTVPITQAKQLFRLVH